MTEKEQQIEDFKARIRQTEAYKNNEKRTENAQHDWLLAFGFFLGFGFLFMMASFMSIFAHQEYTITQTELRDLVKTTRVVDTMWTQDTFQRHKPIKKYCVYWKNTEYYENVDSTVYFSIKKIPTDSAAHYYCFTQQMQNLVQDGGNIRHLRYKDKILVNWYDHQTHSKELLPVILIIVTIMSGMSLFLLIACGVTIMNALNT